MNAKQVAEELLKTPDALVVLQYRGEWVEVSEVTATGQHRNAVTFQVQNQNLGGGVIVVQPNIEEEE